MRSASTTLGTTSARPAAQVPRVRPLMLLGSAPGAGTTLVAAALVHGLRRLGVAAVPMKPATRDRDELQRLAAVSAFGLPARALCPCVGAPSTAARPLDAVVDTFRVLSTWADTVVVDGVVDLQAVLGGTSGSADLARELGLPVVLVVGLRAGCVGQAAGLHAQLGERGAECAGWIANQPVAAADAGRLADELAQALPLPCLGAVAPLARALPSDAARALDLPRVLAALAG